MNPDKETAAVDWLHMKIFYLTSFLCSSFLFKDAGIWFVFHSSSTGDSHGLVPETKAELTPLGIFYNNRVHSNFKVFIFKLFIIGVGSVCAFSPTSATVYQVVSNLSALPLLVFYGP